MGQAKRRGTYEERKANPLGDSPKYNYWTEERIALMKKELTEEMSGYIDKIKHDLFSTMKPKRKKARRIKTGG